MKSLAFCLSLISLNDVGTKAEYRSMASASYNSKIIFL
jgi:hypothetical protein